MSRIQLSRPLAEAEPQYEVIVIGSGYGAAIAASRLARAGRRVALLERGREIRPGDYPRSMTEIAGDAQVRVADNGQRLGRADGLLDLHLNDDLSVLVGCGLGGTSLINANVALESDARLKAYFDWPKVYQDQPGLLAPYYDRARKALGSTPYPDSAPTLPKLAALKQSAAAMGQPFYRPPINVTFQDGPNAFGFAQKACTLCGDCCTGCNYGAKNTTLMNYLPDARAFGAAIFTGAEVRRIARSGDGWQVTVRETGSQDDDTGTRQITASLVVLGAGTLGSTEILQRSAAAGLALSPALGTRFSGNGDVLAFGYNANLDGSFDDKIPRPALRGVGAGTNAPDRPQFQPGPTIAGIIDMRDPRAPVTDGLVIEEGVLPGGFAMAFTAMFFVNEATSGDAFRFGDTALRLKDAAAIGAAITDNPAALGQFAYDGPVGRSQTYLVMSHDSSDGTLAFANDTTVVRWPGVGREASIARDNALLAQASDAIWAEFAPNPLWQDAMGRKLVSVHPIGGCVMADSVDRGVVNAWCQVFDPAGGVHPGLYVCDGSVIPGALGVNPLLTISAISEMAVEKLATDRGWQIDYTSTRPLPADALVAVTPVGKPAEEPTKAELLQQVIDQMAKAKGLIDAGDLDGARAMFHQTYTQITAGAQSHLIPSWTMLRLVLTDGFTTAIGQVIAEFMPILQKVEDRLKAQDYSGALAVIKAEAGDFSPGLGFDEKMSGHIAPAGPHYSHPISDPYRIAAREGETAGEARAITAHFTVAADSIQALMDDPDHQATLTGTLDCAALGGRLTLDKGASFDLLRQNAASVECWNMVYRGTVQGGGLFSHKTFYFKGFKTLQRRPGSTYWADLTTLRVDIWDGPDTTGLPLFQGVMTLGLEDLTHQLSTLKAPMAQGIWQGGADILKRLTEAQWAGNLAQSMQDKALRAEIIREALLLAARSGHEGLLRLVTLQAAESVAGFFGRLIFRVYGGVTAYLYDFPARDDATAPHRKLRLPAPERHTPLLAGGQKLALTRYQGGTLGPVILAPGFGVTADSYTLDTTDENLTEFLVARGYDVWLFDYRGSPALDASREAFDIDDLAHKDWPAAIDMVRRISGAADVQVIAHCFASTSVLMALLAGMKGVRSVLSSQTSLHPVTSWFNYAKADSHLASLLAHGVPKSYEGLVQSLHLTPQQTDLLQHGMKTVSMVGTSDADSPDYLKDKALDALLWQVPFPHEVPCYNPVCHRVFGIFGASYAHKQLNEATHNALGRVFGEISTEPFLQLATILRYGRAVDAQGQDSYMDKPQNIVIPIDFVAGGDNRIFLPETTLRSLRWLRATHPDAPKTMFTRRVFEDYGHMDMFIGKSAHQEVFPYLLDRLQARAPGQQGKSLANADGMANADGKA